MTTERNQRKTVKIEKIGPERKSEDGKTTSQDVINVTVYYSKVGLNYFHGNTDQCGYYISVTPLTIKAREGSLFVSVTTGCKKFVREAARFSAKTLDEVAEQAKISIDLFDAVRATVLAEKSLPSQTVPEPSAIS